MNNLSQARDWAESVSGVPATPRAQAAAELIKSLPDQWVDVEKLHEIIEEMNEYLEAGCSNDYGQGYNYATRHWREALEPLLTPKLPTLADMTQEEREACQWMQCKVETDDGYGIGVIRRIWSSRRADVLYQSGMSLDAEYRRVTPLPDLPKLKWPGDGVVDAEIVDEPETADPDPIHTPMHPSEVPANEPWLIEVDGQKAIGTRHKGSTIVPWSVAAVDGSFAGDFHDNEITLIHKLVPEPPALPEGMRLADHEEYGRVVTSPKPNRDGIYDLLVPKSKFETGADWEYAHECELTFLDGGN